MKKMKLIPKNNYKCKKSLTSKLIYKKLRSFIMLIKRKSFLYMIVSLNKIQIKFIQLKMLILLIFKIVKNKVMKNLIIKMI